jgi:hypothetical protein
LVKAVQGKDVGRHETERGVRAKVVVVVGTLVFDEESGFSEGAKPMLVQAVIAEGAIEALDEGVLHGFAWVDMMESNARGLIPEVEGLPVNSGPLSAGDSPRQLAREGQALENGDDGGSADGGVDTDGQALAGKVIDERQTEEAATGGQLVVDKVHRPAFIGSLRH